MQEYKLSGYDAAQLTRYRRLAEIFESIVQLGGGPKEAANLLIGDCLRLLNADGKEAADLTLAPESLAALFKK